MAAMKSNSIVLIMGTVFISALSARGQTRARECSMNNGFNFQVVTDKLAYAPKSVVHVKFLVTNTDYTQRQDSSTGLYSFRALHVSRLLSYCTSQIVFYSLTVLDQNDKRVPTSVCSSDHEMDKLDAVALFTNPRTGIALLPGEVFGSEEEVQLPAEKGTYRLKAELFTGDFNEKQQQALAEKKIATLPPHCTIPAPVVTITVK